MTRREWWELVLYNCQAEHKWEIQCFRCQLFKWQEGSGESIWVGVMIKRYRRISWKSWWMWRMSGGIVWNMDRRFQFQISNWKRWKQQLSTWRVRRQVYQLLLLLKGWRQGWMLLEVAGKSFQRGVVREQVIGWLDIDFFDTNFQR